MTQLSQNQELVKSLEFSQNFYSLDLSKSDFLIGSPKHPIGNDRSFQKMIDWPKNEDNQVKFRIEYQ